MESPILWIGVDVDDRAFNLFFTTALGEDCGHLKCKPTASALAAKLEALASRGHELRICYEATYLGFSLQRQLQTRGFNCQVIAPSLIPELPGKAQKTDRLDCRKLAEYYAKGLLTVVHVPDELDECIRDLVRSRLFTVRQIVSLKNHILGLCRRAGLDYSAQREGKASLWSEKHRSWLRQAIQETLPLPAQMNVQMLLMQLEQLEQMRSQYENEIAKFAAQERYSSRVRALCAFRGIDLLTAMTLILEIGDVKRFCHPSRLTSYAGMDIREYSSGGKEMKMGISSLGNRYLRTAVVEACQFALAPPRISRPLAKRRQNTDPNLIQIADRCMQRLHKKGTRLLLAGKHRNKVKVACAREMLGFVWESLTALA